jgi:hypothetical protein
VLYYNIKVDAMFFVKIIKKGYDYGL